MNNWNTSFLLGWPIFRRYVRKPPFDSIGDMIFGPTKYCLKFIEIPCHFGIYMKLLHLALDRGSPKYILNAIHGIFFGRWIGMSSDARISHITDVLEESIPAEIRLYLPFLALEAQAYRKPSDQKTHHVTNYDLLNPTLLLDYLNFVDQTLTQKLSHKNIYINTKMSQIFNVSPRFFSLEKTAFQKNKRLMIKFTMATPCEEAPFPTPLEGPRWRSWRFFLIQELLCIKKNLYQEKTERTKNT